MDAAPNLITIEGHEGAPLPPLPVKTWTASPHRTSMLHDGKPVRGVASNFMCDLKVGDKVDVIGPSGASFLMPNHPKSHIVMICTGTGSAPMRAMTASARGAPALGNVLSRGGHLGLEASVQVHGADVGAGGVVLIAAHPAAGVARGGATHGQRQALITHAVDAARQGQGGAKLLHAAAVGVG